MIALYQWFDERLGVAKVWNALFARKVPHAKGPAAWLFTLGSATMLIFGVQFVTGTLLAMNYSPSPDHAYDSVRFIDTQVTLGSLIHGLHHWGATFMVVFTTLHLMRTYFMGAYKYPREMTWLVGVSLFLLVMGFSFTGYLLPWDQKAFWATVVGGNISGQTPVVGGYVKKILLGGEDMGAATLTRFYAIHVLLLPALIVAAIGGHLFLVVWHGISEAPKRAKDGSGS